MVRRANRIVCPVCARYLLRVDQLWVDDNNRIAGCTHCLTPEPTEQHANGRVLTG